MSTQPDSTPAATAEAPDKGVGCDALFGDFDAYKDLSNPPDYVTLRDDYWRLHDAYKRMVEGLPGDAVAAGLKIGQRWGAYWLHADGWMRLYPPLTPTNDRDVIAAMMVDIRDALTVRTKVEADEILLRTYSQVQALYLCEITPSDFSPNGPDEPHGRSPAR